MRQKNLADLYHLDPIPWSRALEALESSESTAERPDLLPGHDATRWPAAQRRSRGRLGRRQGLLRERRRDPQEPEPRRERRLRRLDVARRASTWSSRARPSG